VKIKLSVHKFQAMKVYRVKGGKVACILDFSSRWMGMTAIMPCWFTPVEKSCGIHWIEG
jgi:hypothetical protein